MDATVKSRVLEKWNNYFSGVSLPIGVFYSDELNDAEYMKKPAANAKGYTCIFAQMAKLFRGKCVAFDVDNLGCFGSIGTIFGGIYQEDQTVDLLVNIEHFKKDREQVVAMHKINPKANPTGQYLIMKPYDQLTEEDQPKIVFLLATPDIASAMHCLISYDNTRVDNVIAPFGSGCEQLLSFAFEETKHDNPRAVLGGLDAAMRNCIKPNLLTFSIPHSRFIQMIDNMDDSFLSTYIWNGIKTRATNSLKD